MSNCKCGWQSVILYYGARSSFADSAQFSQTQSVARLTFVAANLITVEEIFVNKYNIKILLVGMQFTICRTITIFYYYVFICIFYPITFDPENAIF